MRPMLDLVCQGLLTQLPTVLIVAAVTSLRAWLRRPEHPSQAGRSASTVRTAPPCWASRQERSE